MNDIIDKIMVGLVLTIIVIVTYIAGSRDGYYHGQRDAMKGIQSYHFVTNSLVTLERNK